MSAGNALIAAFLEVLYAIIDFYVWAVIISALMSWLIAFDIVNPYNRVVHVISDMLMRITEPLLAPIRRFLPPMGGMDLSPLVLIFALYFVQSFIRHLVF
jgi:YggT family protein